MLFNNTNMRTAMAYTNAVGDKVYPVIVDIKKGIKSTEEILFVSSDINTGVLSVAFIQGNDTYNVTGAEVVCSIMRPDASTLDIPCTIVENNIVEVPLGINGTSQDGVYSFDFKVFKGGNKVVGTPTMNYSVSLSISNDNAVLEDDRLPVLTMLMTQVTEMRGLISSLSKRVELLENQSPPIEVNDIKLLYNFNNLKRGYAEGTISLQTSGEVNAGKYYIKWADENGELSEYEEITVFEMVGVNAIQTYNFIKLNLIPIEASRIVAIKDNVIKASFDIPSNKRITDSKKLSFGLISDMHVDGSGGSSSEANDDFVRALKYFDSKQVDMNILTGDAVNNGVLVDLEKFKSLKGSSTNVPLYVCRGNHDTYNDCNVDNFTNYIEENGLHFEKEIKGDKYLFIGLNAEDFTNPFRRDSMEWLKTKLEEYKNQRVFLMQHVFVGETGNIGGLYPHSDGFDMTEGTCSKEFVDLVSKYRNVIMFTGHSHLDFELQRLGENANVALRTKTLCHRVHTPSTSKPRKNDINTEDIPDNTYTYREGSQGYLVDVYDSYIVLHGIDFKKGLLLPYAQYILDTTPILIEGDDNISSEYKLLSETTSFSLGSLSSSGADRESSSSYRTDFIELNERDNKTFILPRGLTYLRICIYDENKTFLKLNEENDNNETPSKTDEIRNLENVAGAKYIKLKCQGDIENIRFNGSI